MEREAPPAPAPTPVTSILPWLDLQIDRLQSNTNIREMRVEMETTMVQFLNRFTESRIRAAILNLQYESRDELVQHLTRVRSSLVKVILGAPIKERVEDAHPLSESAVEVEAISRSVVVRELDDDIEASLHKNLRETFGFEKFRPLQLEVLRKVMAKENVLTVMCTGAGKSLLYQLPATILPGLVVVLSPLTSLIHDQVKKLKGYKIPVKAYYGIDTDGTELDESINIEDVKVVLLTPEKLARNVTVYNQLKNLHGKGRISLIVIDEAQLMVTWGKTFRADLFHLGTVTDKFPSVPILMLSGSITQRMSTEIISTLGLESRCTVFKDHIQRKNIAYTIQEKPSKRELTGVLREFIHANNLEKDCGIIYGHTIRMCNTLAAALSQAGIKAEAYYAGQLDKTDAQDNWMNNETKIICCTSAFALGVDKPDVRYLIFAHMPASLQDFIQLSGRVGRDGKKAIAHLFFSREDASSIRGQIFDKTPAVNINKELAEHFAARELNEMRTFTLNKYCVRKQLDNHVADKELHADAPDLCSLPDYEPCSICRDQIKYEKLDITLIAKLMLREISDLTTIAGRGYTRHKLVGVLRGDKPIGEAKNSTSSESTFSRSFWHWPREYVHSVLQTFINYGLVQENAKYFKTAYDHISVPGRNEASVMPAISLFVKTAELAQFQERIAEHLKLGRADESQATPKLRKKLAKRSKTSDEGKGTSLADHSTSHPSLQHTGSEDVCETETEAVQQQVITPKRKKAT